MEATVQRQEWWFSGRVQGVGFRARTLQVAREFEVTGFVQNLRDGRVHLLAEGETAEVAAFGTEVTRRLGLFIKETETKGETGARSCRDFTISS